MQASRRDPDTHRWTIAVLGGLLTVTAIVAFAFSHSVNTTERAREKAIVDSGVAIVSKALDEYVDIARGMAEVVAADPNLTEEEFRRSADRLLDPSVRDGVSDLRWLAIVAPDEIAGFERSHQFPDGRPFEVHPRSEEPAVVITYRFSADIREDPYGLDVRSIHAKKEAVDKALAGSTPVMTDAIPFQDVEGAVVVYVPVFGDDGKAIGLTNAVIRGSVFSQAISGLPPSAGIEVVDLDGATEVGIARTSDRRFSAPIRVIHPYGQTWGIRVEPGNTLAPFETYLPWIVLVAGSMLSVLITTLATKIRSGRLRAESLVEERTSELVSAIADLGKVNEIGKAISATLDLDIVLKMIVGHAAGVVNADASALFMVDHETRRITHRLTTGISDDELAAHDYEELANGISGYVWHHGTATRSDDIENDNRNYRRAATRATGRSGMSLVVAPIMDGAAVGGTLSVLSRSGTRAFTGTEQTTIDLLAAQASIAIANARLYAELVGANEDLRELHEKKDHLLATVSHELRTPLTVISGAAEMMVDEPDLDPMYRAELIGRVMSNARRLDLMVHDVLFAAQIDAEKIVLRPAFIDVRSAVDRVIAELGDLATGVSNEVENGHRVVADPQHFDRIVINLLTNAHKYGSQPIVVTATADQRGTEVRIRDHGPGIDETMRDRLFGRFEQGDTGSTRRSIGVGLGLNIVRELTTLNNGRVRYIAVEDGACFGFLLPSVSRIANPTFDPVRTPSLTGSPRIGWSHHRGV